MSLLFFASCANSISVKIPAGETVEIENSQYKNAHVALRNKSISGIDVKVIQKENGEFLRGFGLGPVGKSKVQLENFAQLQLTNNSKTTKRVSYKITEKINDQPATKVKSKKPVTTNPKYISFYLTNNSAKSIPLIIPSVMNPNLSPFSKSGVDLKIGQKIFFKKRGKKYLLLEIDDSIKNEQKIEVSSLLRKRKKELGI